MQQKRRELLKLAGLAGLGIAGSALPGFGQGAPANDITSQEKTIADKNNIPMTETSMIGAYGAWASALLDQKMPSLSFRNKTFNDVKAWQKSARQRVAERLAMPVIAGKPPVKLVKQYNYDGLHIEELSWQLAYGPATDAILLKPQGATGKLPAILAFHDHGGNKYFGARKITKTSGKQHPVMTAHQDHYYEGMAWANEIAKRGYVVLVSDAFTFASRRVLLADVPEKIRGGLTDADPENADNIAAYNKWAADHEHIMAKSLFSAGTTWPGVFLAEDIKALDILAAREDVDANRIGCGGLSGGGLRTVFTGGMDPRIKCAVDVGFTTTWKDFALHKSFTHTWMIYVPLLPNELDFPEILGMRAPLPTLVLNDSEDQLYTLPEMKVAEKILTEIYAKAGASDRLKCSYYPGEHKFDKPMQKEAFDWFDKWLK